MTSNPELDLAFKYVSQTRRHIFLTGKAGTGKTTFLHRVRKEIPKRMAVVAPTGVAAINARGVTIHSLFQLPFGVIPPNGVKERSRRFNKEKLRLIQSLDLLVIDEISMVRADVLDAIDEVLRRLRQSSDPFGGLQLLMIGDLHQLPPVVRDEEVRELNKYYRTTYFFGSRALEKARPVNIQLTKIFRQSDANFINLLNRVRDRQLDTPLLQRLNERFRANFAPPDEEGYITLSSHNWTAREINAQKLGTLPTELHIFSATVSGVFPESMYPNSSTLEFRVGAQVMFNKNDTIDQAYFNGKIGRIESIEEGIIAVRCPGEDELLHVGAVTWQNIKYELNPSTKKVEENVIGTYTQHPLKLAWAITIHKSQGLTFDKVIIDAADAFAHGQVYVALSRCRTFEGIVLRTRIEDQSVKTDAVVSAYSHAASERQPTEANWRADRRAFAIDCLRELFGGEELRRTAGQLNRVLLENEKTIQGTAPADFRRLHREIIEKAVNVGQRFQPALGGYDPDCPTDPAQTALWERIRAGGDYFLGYFRNTLSPGLQELSFLTDNQAVHQAVTTALQDLRRTVYVKQQLFEALASPFDPAAYTLRKADAAWDFTDLFAAEITTRRRVRIPANVTNPGLYTALANWRIAEAERREILPFTVLHNTVLIEIARVVPTTPDALLSIHKFGPKAMAKYGNSILQIIARHTRNNGSPAQPAPPPQRPNVAASTFHLTLDLFRQGKDLSEIAALRGLKESTLQGHLCYWVEQGAIPVLQLVPEECLAALLPHLEMHPDAPAGFTKYHFEDRYDYHQIRAVMAHRNWLASGQLQDAG
ncbi:AAA family ATPase [Neolewinella lacunae]|uniref:AAA family ATPase n=1 Tax=Neolewinella lacunae TaxID=1517758 RepID=A0A923PLU6_9BACT|nr:HRDC domain-containing protein [Neolewinella lacunae]MBC6996420.1 AAA family ATPase [Neolewinella lacunae]MDN3633637.1 AAA family ATPase [Neolewinella lacunae]